MVNYWDIKIPELTGKLTFTFRIPISTKTQSATRYFICLTATMSSLILTRLTENAGE